MARMSESVSLHHGAPVDGCLFTFRRLSPVQYSRTILGHTRCDRDPTFRLGGPAAAAGLLAEHELRVGDLVFLPRGTVHRGLGGALVQVITVPGFRPGAEIGVDHLLRSLIELTGTEALPLHAAAADSPVIR